MLGTAVATWAAAPAGVSGRYADGPPPAHTGGFGEPNCRECHFDHRLNAPGGELRLRGFPTTYRGDSVYPLEILLVRPKLARAGFQLAVRFAGGKMAGHSAGWIQTEGRRVQRVRRSSDSVTYAEHTLQGSRPVATDTARWRIRWRAPARRRAPVILHLAANAANGDDSEFGDFIYVSTRESDPTGKDAVAAPAGTRVP